MAGSLLVPNEFDLYQYHLFPNTDYVATAWGKGAGADWTLPNPAVVIIEPVSQTLIAAQDDTPQGSVHPEIGFRVPVEGNYVMAVTDLTGGTGAYSSRITDPAGNIVPSLEIGEYVFDPVSQTIAPTGLGSPASSGDLFA